MWLLSGDYGYLQFTGTTLLAVPIGLRLRELHSAGREGPYLWKLLIGGCLLSAFGAAWAGPSANTICPASLPAK
ncbi:MAG: hypothetical protein EXS09_15990 [Gemmataceae bacterium]|nr:hypothetical protein [Gemmataceae bacterium]